MSVKKRSNLRRLLSYVRPYWAWFLGALCLGVMIRLRPVAVAWIVGETIDVLKSAETGDIASGAAWRRILLLSLGGLALLALLTVPTYFRFYCGARAVQRAIRDLRCELYAHVQKLSHSFFDRNRSGSLTSRIVSDVQMIAPFLNTVLLRLWISVGLIVAVLAYFFSKSPLLAGFSLLLVPVQVLVVRRIGLRVRGLARRIRARLAWMSGNAQEKLAAATVVKAFTHEGAEIQRFRDDSEEIVTMGLRNAHLNATMNCVTGFLSGLGPLLLILLGGRLGLFHPEQLSIGVLVQFILMQPHLYAPFEQLANMQLVVSNALGATDRVFDIFDTEPEVANKPGARKAPRFEGRITFEDIAFSYPVRNGPRIIDGISLEVPARTSLALVGPSGSGKSTIVNLLNRFYELAEGRILVDGTDITDYTVYSLRYQIGLVPQSPVLFSGTIEENILYGRPGANEEEVRQAVANANALDFIEAMPDGMETVVGERGTTLSGGQMQRLAIARAFLKDPSILILDEATSALDSESERCIQEALRRLMAGRTSIAIAHRLATIRDAGQIAVLERGRLVELGTHEALWQRGGLYAMLCEQQFGG